MPEELSRVDELLDDPAFFEPFRPYFHPTAGRRSVPVETFLRLMYLKYRYRVGFESLCREVTDSVSWLRFCRVPFGRLGPGPLDAEEDRQALRAGGRRGIEQGTARKSSCQQGAEDQPPARWYHGRAR